MLIYVFLKSEDKVQCSSVYLLFIIFPRKELVLVPYSMKTTYGSFLNPIRPPVSSLQYIHLEFLLLHWNEMHRNYHLRTFKHLKSVGCTNFDVKKRKREMSYISIYEFLH